MIDKQLVCKDCGRDFVFTENEQKFYIEKGFNSEPVRCKDCRTARKVNRSDFSPRESFFGAKSKSTRFI